MPEQNEPRPLSYRDTIMRGQKVADAAIGRVAAKIVENVPDLDVVIADLELANRQIGGPGGQLLDAIKRLLET